MSTTWAPSDRREDLRIELQRDRVRELLRSAHRDGVCTLMFNALGMPNARNRVYELRDDVGLEIETHSCDRAVYHAGEDTPAHVRFVWRWKPYQPQLMKV